MASADRCHNGAEGAGWDPALSWHPPSPHQYTPHAKKDFVRALVPRRPDRWFIGDQDSTSEMEPPQAVRFVLLSGEVDPEIHGFPPYQSQSISHEQNIDVYLPVWALFLSDIAPFVLSPVLSVANWPRIIQWKGFSAGIDTILIIGERVITANSKINVWNNLPQMRGLLFINV